MTREEHRENGGTEEGIGLSEKQPSSIIKRTITTTSIAALAGMSLLLTLRKPSDIQHAGSPSSSRTTLIASNDREESPVQDARKPFIVTMENGETVPVRFVDDGFTVQINRRFFQLKMIQTFYVPITLGDIRAQLGAENISTMEYQEGAELVCKAAGNTFRVPDASVQKVLSTLHGSAESNTECQISDVAFQLDLADNNSFKAILPDAGTMQVQFNQKEPHKIVLRR